MSTTTELFRQVIESLQSTAKALEGLKGSVDGVSTRVAALEDRAATERTTSRERWDRWVGLATQICGSWFGRACLLILVLALAMSLLGLDVTTALRLVGYGGTPVPVLETAEEVTP